MTPNLQKETNFMRFVKLGSWAGVRGCHVLFVSTLLDLTKTIR
jgi:hypothetical protein